MEINLLFTSAGRRSYLIDYFKAALKAEGIKGKIHATNSSEFAPSFQRADAYLRSPLIYDEEYIPFLLDYCRRNQITGLISLLDTDLPILAANREKFKAINTQLLVSSQEIVNICNDKYATYQFLKQNGIESPRTYISMDLALEDIKNGKLAYPVIIKPRWGTGSISVMDASNADELGVCYKYVQAKTMKSFLKYESAQAINECVIIQELICGEEYGMDVINDLDGRYINTVVKKKIAMRSGETDCAITVNEPMLIALGQKLSQRLKHVANLDVDAFIVEGRPYILEMNARFGGGYPFSHVAGVDEPRAIIRWLAGREAGIQYCSAVSGVMAQKDISMMIY